MLGRRTGPAHATTVAVLALALGCASPFRVNTPLTYLHVVETVSRRAPSAGGPLRIALHGTHSQSLAKLYNPSVIVERTDSLLVIEFDGNPASMLGGHEAFEQSSFVVDWDTPEVESWAREIIEAHGESPPLDAIVASVHKGIEPSMSRGLDVASRVARDRLGDCTEHAVVLAALARRFGFSARVVTGVVLVVERGRYQSYGHAWNEVGTDSGWTIADATVLDENPPVAYLPDAIMTNEGPGYSFALAGSGMGAIEQVEILGR